MLALKIVWDQGSIKSTKFSQNSTFEDMLLEISQKCGIQTECLQLFTGFPPKFISCNPNDTLAQHGITTPTIINVRTGTPPSCYLNRPNVIDENTLVRSILIELGFEEQLVSNALYVAPDNAELAAEICGEMLGDEITCCMHRHVINADNSCLFNAIIYSMKLIGLDASKLRQVISDSVLKDPQLFNESFLGKKSDEYALWITQPHVWGGEIEMYILAQHFHIEIVAVDIETCNYYSYSSIPSTDSNNSMLNKRIYVLYDGVHYDSLIKRIERRSTIDKKIFSYDLTEFLSDDTNSLEQAIQVAKDLRNSKKYVNLSGCDLKCLVCGVGLKGQKEALQHASDTNHQNFGQI